MYEQPKTWKIGPSFLAGGFLFALGLMGFLMWYLSICCDITKDEAN